MPLVRKKSFQQPLIKNGQKSLAYTSDTDGGGDSLAVLDCCATATHARIGIGPQMSFLLAVLANRFNETVESATYIGRRNAIVANFLRKRVDL